MPDGAPNASSQETPRASPPVRKPAVSKGAIAILMAGIAIVLAAGFFAQDIKGGIALKAWSKGDAREALDGFVTALKSGDPTQVKQWVDEESVLVIEDGGKVSALRGGPNAANPPAPIPVAQLIPSGPAGDAVLEYNLSAQPHPTLSATLPGAGGESVNIVLNRLRGAWRVEYFRVTKAH